MPMATRPSSSEVRKASQAIGDRSPSPRMATEAPEAAHGRDRPQRQAVTHAGLGQFGRSAQDRLLANGLDRLVGGSGGRQGPGIGGRVGELPGEGDGYPRHVIEAEPGQEVLAGTGPAQRHYGCLVLVEVGVVCMVGAPCDGAVRPVTRVLATVARNPWRTANLTFVT